MTIRAHLSTATKIAVGVAAIWWVSRTVSVADVLSACSNADGALLTLAVLVFFLTPVLQGVRLRRLFEAQGMPIRLHESIHLAFAGNFVNFAIPVGSTTGDVFKAAYLARKTGKAFEATTVTFVDRCIGVGTLVVTVAAIAFVSPSESPLAPLRPALLAICVALFCGLALLRWFPTEGRAASAVASATRRVPGRTALLRTFLTARSCLRSLRVLALTVLDTLGIQIAAAASFLLAAIALGFATGPADWMDIYAFFSAGEIVKALPGPPQGLGTLEAAYGVFFHAWATPAQVVSAALAVRVINLVCALPGAAMAVASLPGIETGKSTVSTDWAANGAVRS